MSTVEISNIVAGWQDWDGAQAQVYLFSSQHSELLEIILATYLGIFGDIWGYSVI